MRIDVGVDPQADQVVADPFYQVDPARASENTGSGLGLSIARVIVEPHGGKISQPGWTTFTIALPQG